MAESPFYPRRPCLVAEIKNHPAFVMLMKEQQTDKLRNPPVFYELARIAQDPNKYSDGMGLYDFMLECSSRESGEGALKELIRMNVYRLETNGISRLVPCWKIEADSASKTKHRIASVYLLTFIHDAVKARAAQDHMSMSRVHELALAAYLGIPADTADTPDPPV